MNITSKKGPGRSPLPKIMAAASIILFGISLTQHGSYGAGDDPMKATFGSIMLLLGWITVPAGCFAWLGNPLLFAAWLFFLWKKDKLSAWFSFAAFLAMLEFLLFREVPQPGGPVTIVGRGAAYWLWLSSSALMTLSSVSALRLKKEEPNQPPESF